MVRLQHGAIALQTAILAVFMAASPAAAQEPEAASGGLAAFAGAEEVPDAIAPEQLAEIRASVADYKRRKGLTAAPGQEEAPFLFPFFPHAGLQGKDLYLSNFTDQDPGSVTRRDWDCSAQTYDGHQGHDSLIRSFREQAIGVPIFAVRDGVVVATRDGEPDMNTVWDPTTKANYVLVDHGNGYFTWYLHMRSGSVAVSPGQAVTAGTQLGLTGSSGLSNWPHLHFETHKDDNWIETSAGPCRPGDSLWVSQPPVPRDFYVADFYLAQGAILIPDYTAWLHDPATRKATFLKGAQRVGARVDMRSLPAHSTYRIQVLDPRGKVVFEGSGSFENPVPQKIAVATFWFDMDLSPGTWRFRADVNDSPAVDAPFRVVASSRQVKNRRPQAVKTLLTPARPVAGQVMTCEVRAPLIARDPDYDIVSYRYEWKVNNRVVRSVTSAALTDLLAAGKAKPGDRVSCRVTPSDGKALAPAAVAEEIVEEP
jgi:murein DD-endopeptidase MepM/ murein hydrolase activator NlpD